MARFFGLLKGGRGEATRLGTPKSGLVARLTGFEIGVKLEAEVEVVRGKEALPEKDRDIFNVVVMGGTHLSGAVRDDIAPHRILTIFRDETQPDKVGIEVTDWLRERIREKATKTT